MGNVKLEIFNRSPQVLHTIESQINTMDLHCASTCKCTSPIHMCMYIAIHMCMYIATRSKHANNNESKGF